MATAELVAAQCCNAKPDTQKCRIVIIGGGSAAFAAATAAAPLAATVKIVNNGLPMGGCCVNVGCVPSKFLIRASHISSPYNSHPPYNGFSHVPNRVTDFAALTGQNRSLVESLREDKYASVIAGLPNVEYITGFGRLHRREGQLFVTVHHNHIDETPYQTLITDRVILATGVHNGIPKHLRLDLQEIPYLTNETAYFESVRPQSLIVLGGGYVAVEAAQMFARLGSQVILLQRSSHLLSNLSEDIGHDLAEYLKEEGVEVTVGLQVLSVVSQGDYVEVTAKHNNALRTFTASKIFIATGRNANTAKVSEIPIRLSDTPHGGFIVSDTMQTSVSGVYAAGDCVADSHGQYVYTAAAEGKLAALNALASFCGGKEEQMNYSVVPWVVFSSPAVAGVGLDMAAAQANGIDAEASTVPLTLLPRAIVQRDTRGFVTLIRNRCDDTIIGARVLAEDGGELIMEAALCVRYKTKTQEVAAMFHPYLTWNEVWKLAALGFVKNIKQLSCCAT